MTRPNPELEALTAALAERAREQAGGAGGSAPAALPEPEEMLDYLAGRLEDEDAQRIERLVVAEPEAARMLLDLADFEMAGAEAGAEADSPARSEAGGETEANPGAGAAAEPGDAAGSPAAGRPADPPPPVDLASRAGWRDLKSRLPAGRRNDPYGGASTWPLRLTASLAAALAVATVGLGYRAWTLAQRLDRPEVNLASFYLYADTRASDEPTFELVPGERLRLVIEPNERCDRYLAVIEGPGRQLPIEGLVRSPDATLTVGLRLEPGRHSLRLTGTGCAAPGWQQEWDFRVTSPSAGPGG